MKLIPRMLLSTTVALTTLPIFAKDLGRTIGTPIHRNPCEAKMVGDLFKRATIIETPSIHDPVGLIKAELTSSAWGSVRTFFSPEWDTQVFFTATGIPTAERFELPLVDPDAKAVVLFIHGSGTMKSSGSNYVTNMGALANIGYSAIAIDLPFHGGGPLQSKLEDADGFTDWLKKIVEDIKASGKPVYIAGHSFGPDVVFEMISRYPDLLAGGTALSPAAFNKTLEDWYVRFTQRMRFGGDVAENESGSIWAAKVTNGFLWNTGALLDPTVENPNLKLRILSGNWEEYVPAPVGGTRRTPIGPNTYDIKKPLQKIFSGAAITIEDGIGHYLFDFTDANGFNAVQREMMLMLGENPAAARQITTDLGAVRERRSAAEKLAHSVHFDWIFRAWYLSKYKESLARKLLHEQNNAHARAILDEFERGARAEITARMMNEVFETERTHPEFFQQHREAIESAKAKRTFDTSLLGLYFRHLNAGYSITTN